MPATELFNNETQAKAFNCIYKEHLREFPISDSFTIDNIDSINMGNHSIFITDINHPYCTLDSGFISGMQINEEYYKANQEQVEEEILEIIRNYKGETISIRALLYITPKVIDALVKNENIKKITFGSIYSKEKGYILTKGLYLRFKAANKELVTTYSVEESLEDVFDPIIAHNANKKLIGTANYQSLTSNETLLITSPVEKWMYSNIKYLPDGKNITITYDDFANIGEFLLEISKSDAKPNITIKFSNTKLKSSLTEILLAHQEELADLNLNIRVALEDSIPFMKYLEYEKKLFELIAPAINLSPFERYLYAYKVVSHYKIYKESANNKQESRKLYSLLDNEFMVCVGYSTLLGDLLEKLGIESIDYSVTTELTFDGISKDILVTPDYVETKMGHHARRIVHLQDPKYGIDGLYIADPTWDNILQIDSFCYSALTPNESVQGARYFQFNNYDGTELLHINSLEEFYEKINYMLKHTGKLNEPSSKGIYEPETKLIETLLGLLRKLDADFVINFVNQYPDLQVSGIERQYRPPKYYNLSEIQEMLLILGEYILTKVNTPISGECYEQALYEMYLNGERLGQKEALTKIEKALHNTYVVTRDRFPKRMKINQNEEEEIYDNATNKFAKYNLKAEPVEKPISL